MPKTSFQVFLVVLAFAARAFAQTPATAVSPYSQDTLTELNEIARAALESEYAYQATAHLSENIGPRLSGSTEAAHAVDYVAYEMRRLGLEVQLEEVRVPHWVRGVETGALIDFPGQAYGTTQKIVLTALGLSVATPIDGIKAEVVVVNDFKELEVLGGRARGKIVLFNVKFDKELAAEGYGGEAYHQAIVYRMKGPSAAARFGAVAALVRSVGGADYRLPHTGMTVYAADAPKIPAAAVTAEDANLIEHLSYQGPVLMHLVLTPQTLPDVTSYNVIGDLRGTEHPEQVIVVSGHLDSWDLATGSLDDAAGVAVSLETAHLLTKLRLHPKRTIRVIAWMSEEVGVVGGNAYAEDHASEFANHFAAIETDTGAGNPAGIKAAGKKEVLPLLGPVSEVLRDVVHAGVLQYVDGVGADVDPMTRAGVPSFAPLQDMRDYFKYHHTPADTLDKVGQRELQRNAAVVAVLTYALSQIQQPLPR